MKEIFEFSTWQTSPEWKAKEEAAIKAAKEHKGAKWIVAQGEWGVRTFLVLAESKEEARTMVWDFTNDNETKTKVRNVTNSKKYN